MQTTDHWTLVGLRVKRCRDPEKHPLKVAVKTNSNTNTNGSRNRSMNKKSDFGYPEHSIANWQRGFWQCSNPPAKQETTKKQQKRGLAAQNAERSASSALFWHAPRWET
jgi:hypothetical protein